jgi:signal transduction histidine kinase
MSWLQPDVCMGAIMGLAKGSPVRTRQAIRVSPIDVSATHGSSDNANALYVARSAIGTLNGPAMIIVLCILPLTISVLDHGLGRGLIFLIFSLALCCVGVGVGASARTLLAERARLQSALACEQRKLREANALLLEEAAQRRTVEATLHQAQKTEAIGHLTGGLAHDFNNLLQVIVGNVILIREVGGNIPKIVEYTQAAEQAAFRGAELTSSLLAFARRHDLRTVPVDINGLLREFEPLLVRTLAANVRFEIALAPDVPFCLADPALFQSAVLNLAINARDAMPEGGVLSVTSGVVTLTSADLVGNPDASPGRFVRVSVRDSGVGMTAEVLDRAFEPFFTTKGIGKGSGLGLSQVYAFARQSGGHIGLLSAPNLGTEVILYLPAAETDATGAARCPN